MTTHLETADTNFKENELWIRSILESANDAFVGIDHQGVIQQWNRKAELVFGWLKEEIIGQNLAKTIIPVNYREAHLKGIERMRKTGEAPVLGKTLELTALRKNGTVFPIEITIWKTPNREEFNAFIRDISDKKSAEEKQKQAELELKNNLQQIQHLYAELKQTQTQLLQSEKMASIGTLAAGVAHEINNPLTFIIGNFSLLQDYFRQYTKAMEDTSALISHVEKGDFKKAQFFLDEFKTVKVSVQWDQIIKDTPNLLKESSQGLERIKTIVTDLKTFSCKEPTETVEHVKIERVIDDMLTLMMSELKNKAELIKDYSDTPLVEGHSQRLAQVFLNLLLNASQTIVKWGKITIRTYQKNDYVCVDIADTGEGIPREDLTKLFDPFFTTKPIGEGTGLGLSISYDIVKKYKGDITVTSELGKGSTFTVMLPIASSAVVGSV